jgi:hypothetical protein
VKEYERYVPDNINDLRNGKYCFTGQNSDGDFYREIVKKLVKFSAIYRAGRYKGGVLGREVFEVLLHA